MKHLKHAAWLGVLLFAASNTQAQVVRVGVGVALGTEPVCGYGYYPYYPYACAPVGYWGANYFVNGGFMGVGPWYHAHGYLAYRPGGYRPGFRPVYPYRAPVHASVGRGNRGSAGGFPGRAAVGFHGGFHR